MMRRFSRITEWEEGAPSQQVEEQDLSYEPYGRYVKVSVARRRFEIGLNASFGI